MKALRLSSSLISYLDNLVKEIEQKDVALSGIEVNYKLDATSCRDTCSGTCTGTCLDDCGSTCKGGCTSCKGVGFL